MRPDLVVVLPPFVMLGRCATHIMGLTLECSSSEYREDSDGCLLSDLEAIADFYIVIL